MLDRLRTPWLGGALALASLAAGCHAAPDEAADDGASGLTFRPVDRGGFTPIERLPPPIPRRQATASYPTTCGAGEPPGFAVRTATSLCGDVYDSSGRWSGRQTFPGTPSPECLFTWASPSGAPPSLPLLEAIAVADSRSTHIVPWCASLNGSIRDDVVRRPGTIVAQVPCDDPAADPRLRLEAWCPQLPDGELGGPNRMPSCPSCGMVFGDKAYVMLPADLASKPYLLIETGDLRAIHFEPGGNQAVIVPVAGLGFVDGQEIAVY